MPRDLFVQPKSTADHSLVPSAHICGLVVLLLVPPEPPLQWND
jgi:hypothetical protein